MDKIKVVKALAPLQIAFKKDFDKEQLAFYVEMLQDLDPELLFLAVKKIISKSRFLPSIAEIRENCESLTSTATGKRELNADEAWGIVMKAVKDTTRYEKPKFNNKAIQSAVNNLGWSTIYDMLESEQGMVRAHFRDFYNSALKRKVETESNINIIVSLPEDSRIKALMSKALEGKSLKEIRNE